MNTAKKHEKNMDRAVHLNVETYGEEASWTTYKVTVQWLDVMKEERMTVGVNEF